MQQADRDATRKAFSKPAAFVLLTKGLTLTITLTATRAGALLAYDPATGALTWLSNGRSATRGHPKGYLCVTVAGKTYLAHRVAWLMVNGDWPKHQIDHLNGIRNDNRIANLRDVEGRVNYQNQRAARSNNKSCGLLGVTWDKSRNAWKASIRAHDGSNRFLGRFNDPFVAHQAYLTVKRDLHPGCTI